MLWKEGRTMKEPQTYTINVPQRRASDRLVERPGPVIDVEPPVACFDLHPLVQPESPEPLELVAAGEVPSVEKDLHARLLGESLTRHRRLWKSLAAR
jgi:hypothetical protein